MTKASPAGDDGSLLFALALLGLTYLVMDLARQLHRQREQIDDLSSRVGETPIEGEIVEDAPPAPKRAARKTTASAQTK